MYFGLDLQLLVQSSTSWASAVVDSAHSDFIFFQSHTILLVQPGKKPEGRTYSDYESVNECLEGKYHNVV